MNWGPGAQGGFQNALMTGLQLGQMAGQQKREREFKNALSQFNPDDPSTLKPIMQARPEVGIQLQGQVDARAKARREAEIEQTTADLTQRFLNGDRTAGDELVRINLPLWMQLDTRQKQEAAAQSELIGGIALELRRTPYAQRRDKFIAYSQRFPQFAEKLNELAFLPEQEQSLAIDAYAVSAGLVGKMIEMDAPNYRNLGPEEVLVNMKDPQAIGQFASDRQQRGGGQVAILMVQTPEQAAALPAGTRYRTPDGAEYIR